MGYLISHLRALTGARFFILTACYAAVLGGALWFSYQIRFDFAVPTEINATVPLVIVWVVGLKLLLLFIFGQYSGLLSYFSIPDLQRIFLALVVATLTMGLVRWTEGVEVAPPRGVILADFLFSFLGIAGLRLGFRMYRQNFTEPVGNTSQNARRVGIIGAGDVGAHLAHELLAKRGLGLKPVAFFDDNPNKWRSRIHGVPVIGPLEKLLEEKQDLQLDEAIIAMPSASAKRIGEVVKVLQEARIKFETVPSLDQLATGKVRVSQLRSVEIQDLLGRDAVTLTTDRISQLIKDQVIMVTGAGGSIGGELCRQIAAYRPRRLVLLEQCEVQMFLVEQELISLGYKDLLAPVVADILDEKRMRRVFAEERVDVLFHAAAHKHVPLMESQPGEAIRNNSIGTARLTELAHESGVGRFVLISTDKAINPTNVMGATKRLAEMFLQSFHQAHPGRTKFMAVRFGNVLGSSGSVIPTFKRQISEGGPVKVTHPDVTRYFMTIPEAVGLVLQSATQGEGGEIFVLDMGKPIKIVDLARKMIELSGLRPGEDIEIQFIGLRPGEKLFEELCYDSENMDRTVHPKVMRLKCAPAQLAQLKLHLSQLEERLHTSEALELKLLLKRLVPEYQPYLTEAKPELAAAKPASSKVEASAPEGQLLSAG
jgi:FlaA1/EpsC-like NDP-sugar epimerase